MKKTSVLCSVLMFVLFSVNAFAQNWETTPETAEADLEAQFNKAPSDTYDFTKAKEWKSGNTKYKFAPFIDIPSELKANNFDWGKFFLATSSLAAIAGGTAMILVDYYEADPKVTHIAPTGTKVTGGGQSGELGWPTYVGGSLVGVGIVGGISYIIWECLD